MMARVFAALRALGGRNAGTPLLIASTPVSAVQPEANARRTSSRVKIPPTWAVRCSCWVAVAASGSCPVSPLDRADDEHQVGQRDEGVGRDRERPPGLPDAAQVGQRQAPR